MMRHGFWLNSQHYHHYLQVFPLHAIVRTCNIYIACSVTLPAARDATH